MDKNELKEFGKEIKYFIKLKRNSIFSAKKTFLRTLIIGLFLMFIYSSLYLIGLKLDQPISFSYIDYFSAINIFIFDIILFNIEFNKLLVFYIMLFIPAELVTMIILNEKNIKNHFLFKYIIKDK